MKGPTKRFLRLGFGACALAIATMVLAPIAEADGKPIPVSMRLSFRDVPGGQ
jgi:hypothetical protein